MAHKLAEVWSVQLLTSRGFIPNGKMDLRSMDNNGNLDEGEHDHDGRVKEKIKGTAKPVGDTFAVSIKTKDNNRGSYNGLLVRDSGNEMAIAGSYVFTRQRLFEGSQELELSEELKFLLAQDEGVWVITKP